jgi:putative sterol carrier protein
VFPVLNKPRDFVGNILGIVLERELEDEKRRAEIKEWNMSVVLDTDYYPVTVYFSNGIRIERGAAENPTLTLKTTMTTMVHLAGGKLSPIRGFLLGKLKVKGLFRHPRATWRFYRLMISALRG